MHCRWMYHQAHHQDPVAQRMFVQVRGGQAHTFMTRYTSLVCLCTALCCCDCDWADSCMELAGLIMRVLTRLCPIL